MATLGRPSLIDSQGTEDGRARVPILLPVAGELQGALADWFAEGLVRRDGVEPFALGVLRLDGALELSRSDFLWVTSEGRDAEFQRLRQRF